MIGVEHHNEVRPRGGELFFLGAEQLCDLAIGTVSLDEKWEHRRMRHSESGNDLCHTPKLLLPVHSDAAMVAILA